MWPDVLGPVCGCTVGLVDHQTPSITLLPDCGKPPDREQWGRDRLRTFRYSIMQYSPKSSLDDSSIRQLDCRIFLRCCATIFHDQHCWQMQHLVRCTGAVRCRSWRIATAPLVLILHHTKVVAGSVSPPLDSGHLMAIRRLLACHTVSRNRSQL